MHIEIYFQELAHIIVNADKSTSYKAGLVVINSLSFYLGRSFISPSFLKDSFTKYTVLGWQFFSAFF